MHVTIVQPLLARKQLTWEQVRVLQAFQHDVEVDQGHGHLWKKKEMSLVSCSYAVMDMLGEDNSE